MPRLILVRHGQSQWNLENRFTGWWDVDLTEKGEQEARDAGALLAARGMLPTWRQIWVTASLSSCVKVI